MKAAIFEDIETIVYKKDYPKPEPGSGQVLVRVKYCAICGSDITNFKYKLYQTPLIMGHEFSGQVESIGEGVEDFKIGEKVIGINVLRESYGEVSGLGIFRNGGFAQYVIVDACDLFHVPDSISYQEAAMIESFAVAVRAIKYSGIEKSKNIIIVGGGNIGLITLNVLLAEKDPNYVVVVEPHDYLRNKAIELGAIDAFPPGKSKLRRFFKKNGPPSYVFECAGNEKALNLAIDMVERQGVIILEGIQKGSISLPIFLLNNKEITLKGSISHDRQDVKDAISLIAEKKVNPTFMISKVEPLKKIQAAFNSFLEEAERRFIKLLIEIP